LDIAVVDYGMGNIRSVSKALERVAPGVRVRVTADPAQIRAADRVVVPGQGAMPDCMRQLAASGAREAVVECTRAKPFLGICIGMQMLATRGLEFEPTEGFDWIGGEVVRIEAEGLKVPHMGWNDLVLNRPHPLLEGIGNGDHAYFVHSYHLKVADPADLLAHADYGGPVSALVGRDNVAGAQFHPEKSQRAGLRLIANFLDWRP
jgi:glutamine amidotransferase